VEAYLKRQGGLANVRFSAKDMNPRLQPIQGLVPAGDARGVAVFGIRQKLKVMREQGRDADRGIRVWNRIDDCGHTGSFGRDGVSSQSSAERF